VNWNSDDNSEIERYVVYRSRNGGPFQPVGIQVRGVHRYEDFLGKPDESATYKITASDRNYRESGFSEEAVASTRPMSDDELLTMVQEASFRFYWEGAHPSSGMARENLPGDDRIVATGASGFGIMALVVGAERHFVTREQAVERLLKITRFLTNADHYHGVWPHFMNGATGHRMPVFDMFDNGADLVETSFLMEGLLTARRYFNRENPQERELNDHITKLWQQVEWDWFQRTSDGKALYWHWSPEYSWHINHPLTGWNEVMISYLLAIASPTHGVPARLYDTGWAGVAKEFLNGHSYYGIKLDLGMGTGGPLFFTHYSYMGFDPHGLRDRYTDYFENNRNMAQINHAYCVQNPAHFKGYSEQSWGITAVDGPRGYVPYEPTPKLDDGTIAPTGAISSFPYTPRESMQALKYFYRELGDRLWDVYGFRDAFNLEENWFSRINMGLNQAPMVVMIENHRSGIIWKSFMANPEIHPALERIGFK
jgi:exo beta-1,2-glucooligosaccharide sophorohydrolase (non-reducing end)